MYNIGKLNRIEIKMKLSKINYLTFNTYSSFKKAN